MQIGLTIKIALKSLWANKLRSFLAVLGIIIGVGAVISMLAIGSGAKKQVLERIQSMGTRLIVIRPGQSGMRGVSSGSTNTLLESDARALFDTIEEIEAISPVVNGNSQVKYYSLNSRVNITGVAVTYPEIRNDTIEHGRMFTELEVENRARVAIIGPTTAENIGFTVRNIGEEIKIQGINFKVIGMLKAKGDQGWFSPDDRIIVPYTTAMNTLFGVTSLNEIDIQVMQNADLTKVEEKITEKMRALHKISPGAEDDFNVRNQKDFIETATEFNRTFTILLGAIASISLLVGGIGIMNIMLVTVTERTREIGIRKAIGAKERDILRQFLLESMIMSGMGGLIGIGLGVGAAKVIGSTTEFMTSIDPIAIGVSFSFAVAVGIFFGFYPARRAAVLDPIQSLYYE